MMMKIYPNQEGQDDVDRRRSETIRTDHLRRDRTCDDASRNRHLVAVACLEDFN